MPYDAYIYQLQSSFSAAMLNMMADTKQKQGRKVYHAYTTKRTEQMA